MVDGTSGSLNKAGSMKMTQTTMITARSIPPKTSSTWPSTVRRARPHCANTPDGWNRLARPTHAKAGVQRIGIEATGGYEPRRHPASARPRASPSSSCNRSRSRRSPSCTSARAKNDRLDAILIAACTVALDARNAMPPDPRFDELGDHLTFIEQIEDDIARFKTRIQHIADKRRLRVVAADIARLETRRTRRTEAPDRGVVRACGSGTPVRPGAHHSRHR